MNNSKLLGLGTTGLLRAFGMALLMGLAPASAFADIVYVTAMTSNCVSTVTCGSGANPDLNGVGNPVYLDEGGWGAYTSAKAGTPDKATVPGARYHSNSFSNSTPDLGILISPGLAVPGAVYRVYHVFSSTAGNVSTNIILGVTNVEGCTLSWTTTDKFQSSYGQPSPQTWQLLGYLTNNPGAAFPRIRFYFVGGDVNAGAQHRLLIEQFRFVLNQQCTDVPAVGVTGPLSVDVGTVTVTGVSAGATNVAVWQDTGSGMVQIGTRTNGVVAGNNSVSVTGLVKGAKVAASQTLNGVAGCTPANGFGINVGGGANPRLRVALSFKENPTATGPVGANGATGANSNIHFMPATEVLGGSAPGAGALVIYPSNTWQTVNVPGRQDVADASNAAGTLVAGSGYPANDAVTLQVYAFRNLPIGVTIYSATPAQSTAVTSNNVFVVNWAWTGVTNADGYRLLRDVNSFGYNEYVDVPTNNYTDANLGWTPGANVLPTTSQGEPSVLWFPSANTSDTIPGAWAILESIAFVSDDPTDNGPFDIYIDTLANGTNGVFQDFESFAAGTGAGVVFNQPSYSGTTSANLLSAPDVAAISNATADTGTNSLRVRWQFASGTTNLWMRFNTFNTSAMPNPLVSLDQPVSFRLLMLPVGAPLPGRPSLSANSIGGRVVLNWTGSHTLQTATQVNGTYTNVPGVTVAPYTNTFTEPQRFFRLAN